MHSNHIALIEVSGSETPIGDLDASRQRRSAGLLFMEPGFEEKKTLHPVSDMTLPQFCAKAQSTIVFELKTNGRARRTV